MMRARTSVNPLCAVPFGTSGHAFPQVDANYHAVVPHTLRWPHVPSEAAPCGRNTYKNVLSDRHFLSSMDYFAPIKRVQ